MQRRGSPGQTPPRNANVVNPPTQANGSDGGDEANQRSCVKAPPPIEANRNVTRVGREEPEDRRREQRNEREKSGGDPRAAHLIDRPPRHHHRKKDEPGDTRPPYPPAAPREVGPREQARLR